MKSIFFVLLCIIFSGCGSNDDGNTILPNTPVNVNLNLNLPSNQSLLFNNGSVYVPNHGIKGIIVFRFSNADYRAWDAACPHISPSNCSTMTINGVKMLCPCDNTEFSILDGSPLSGTKYAARQYRVIKNGNILTITNF